MRGFGKVSVLEQTETTVEILAYHLFRGNMIQWIKQFESKKVALALAVLAVLLVPSVAFAAGEASSFAAAQERGLLYMAASAFGFGLLVSLTPCVYPMVAITVSVFGANESKSRFQAFLLSGAFVLGLALLFVGLGIGAAMTGATFGALLANKWFVIGLCAVFVALALSMFGLFDLDLPSGLKNKLAGAGGSGYMGAFVLGLVCAPIAAPCTGPFLTGLLAWIAKTQSVEIGALAMTMFAFGLGTPFFLVGAFALQLPKSGMWMVHVKSVMGIILLVVALYFLGNAFTGLTSWADNTPLFFGISAAAIVLGLVMGAVHKAFEGEGWMTRILKGSGIAIVTVAGFGIITGFLIPEATLHWEKSDAPLAELMADAKVKAKSEDRPMFLDFGAAWCIACKEIETKTFPDERVQQAAGRFVSVKVDMTNDDDPEVEKASDKFEIVGLPTLILFNSQGDEVKRFTDFVEPEQLAQAMNAVN